MVAISAIALATPILASVVTAQLVVDQLPTTIEEAIATTRPNNGTGNGVVTVHVTATGGGPITTVFDGDGSPAAAAAHALKDGHPGDVTVTELDAPFTGVVPSAVEPTGPHLVDTLLTKTVIGTSAPISVPTPTISETSYVKQTGEATAIPVSALSMDRARIESAIASAVAALTTQSPAPLTTTFIQTVTEVKPVTTVQINWPNISRFHSRLSNLLPSHSFHFHHSESGTLAIASSIPASSMGPSVSTLISTSSPSPMSHASTTVPGTSATVTPTPAPYSVAPSSTLPGGSATVSSIPATYSTAPDSVTVEPVAKGYSAGISDPKLPDDIPDGATEPPLDEDYYAVYSYHLAHPYARSAPEPQETSEPELTLFTDPRTKPRLPLPTFAIQARSKQSAAAIYKHELSVDDADESDGSSVQKTGGAGMMPLYLRRETTPDSSAPQQPAPPASSNPRLISETRSTASVSQQPSNSLAAANSAATPQLVSSACKTPILGFDMTTVASCLVTVAIWMVMM